MNEAFVHLYQACNKHRCNMYQIAVIIIRVSWGMVRNSYCKHVWNAFIEYWLYAYLYLYLIHLCIYLWQVYVSMYRSMSICIYLCMTGLCIYVFIPDTLYLYQLWTWSWRHRVMHCRHSVSVSVMNMILEASCY